MTGQPRKSIGVLLVLPDREEWKLSSVCEEGESDVCQGTRARKMTDLTQIWKGGLKTKESPRQSQAWGTFRGGGSQGVGRHQGGWMGASPHSPRVRQMGAPPGPGAEICKDPAAGKGGLGVCPGEICHPGKQGQSVCLGARNFSFIYLFSPPNTSSMFPQYKDSPFHDHSSTLRSEH